MSDDNKTLVRRLLDEVWAAGNLDVAEDVIDVSYRAHMPDAFAVRMSRWTGPQIVRAEVAAYRSAFPDLVVDLRELIAEGEFVAAFWSLSGMNTGRMLLLPFDGGADEELQSTGRDLSASGSTRFRVAAGKITDAKFYWQPFGLLDQVRLFSHPGRTLNLGGGVQVSRAVPPA